MLEGAKSMGAGAATIASAGAAIGIGNVLSSSIHSVARNPSLAKQLFGYAILGFALTEAIASFAPMMAFLISFVFQDLVNPLLKTKAILDRIGTIRVNKPAGESVALSPSIESFKD
nr:ATP synthase F0 subunit 9 [Alkekengi officinarum var. franchetii]WIV69131.1 ATP synthase subunit 9 [Withania somnifera]